MTTVAEILGSMRGRIEREIGKENAARIIAGVRAGIVRETGPMVVPELVREAEKICDDAGVKDPLIRQRLIASFEKYFRNEWDARANPTRRLR